MWPYRSENCTICRTHHQDLCRRTDNSVTHESHTRVPRDTETGTENGHTSQERPGAGSVLCSVHWSCPADSSPAPHHNYPHLLQSLCFAPGRIHHIKSRQVSWQANSHYGTPKCNFTLLFSSSSQWEGAWRWDRAIPLGVTQHKFLYWLRATGQYAVCQTYRLVSLKATCHRLA